MLNTSLLATKDDLNDFTKALKERCLKEGAVLVRMRSGDWVEVLYQPINELDGIDKEFFRTIGYSYYWDANGESITSDSYDLIEFK